MLTMERKFLQFITRHIYVLGALAVVVLSVMVRIAVLPARNEDINNFFLPWYLYAQEHGLLELLRSDITNYNVPFLCVLWLVTKLPVPPVVAMKALAVLFDYAQAMLLALLVVRLWNGRGRRLAGLAAFALGCLLPVVVLNSSYWGQYEAFYSFFVLAAVYAAIEEKYPAALVLLAVAGSIKLQAWFALPVFVMLYCIKKKFSLLWFGALPLALFVGGIPAYIAGQPLSHGFDVYFAQIKWFRSLTMNYPNWYAFFTGPYETLSAMGYIMALTALGAMLVWLLALQLDITGPEILGLAAWCSLACTLFLPSMHERYGYFAEIAFCGYLLLRPKVLTAAAVAVLHGCTLITYAAYFFGGVQHTNRWLAVANYAAFFVLTLQLVRAVLHNNRTEQPLLPGAQSSEWSFTETPL